MNEGFVIQFFIVGILGLLIALAGFILARKSGLLPAQTLLISTLKDINMAQLSKITELNVGITGHTQAVKELKETIIDLQSSILSLVEENRTLSASLGSRAETPVARKAVVAVDKATEVVNGLDEEKA